MKNDFRKRVNTAYRMMIAGEDGRALDDCFEMYDGACVAAMLYRAALEGDERIREAIERDFKLVGGFEACPWKERAAERDGWSVSRIEIEAAHLREEGRRASLKFAADHGQLSVGLFDADGRAQGDLLDA